MWFAGEPKKEDANGLVTADPEWIFNLMQPSFALPTCDESLPSCERSCCFAPPERTLLQDSAQVACSACAKDVTRETYAALDETRRLQEVVCREECDEFDVCETVFDKWEDNAPPARHQGSTSSDLCI